MDKVYDYYYSKSHENHLRTFKDYHQNSVLIDGTWYIYTEAIEKGHEPMVKKLDTVKLTECHQADEVYYGTKPGAKRCIIKQVERPCDSYCQWCNRSCYTDVIEKV